MQAAFPRRNGVHSLLRISLISLACTVLSNCTRAGSIFDDDYLPPATRPSATTPIPTIGSTRATSPVGPDKFRDEHKASLQRIPIPSQAEQSRSRKLFKEAFAAELKNRTPAARRELSARLIAEGDKVADNASDRFVLLLGARDAAAEGGDLTLVVRTADLLATAYDVDSLHLKAEAAVKTSLKSDAPDHMAENIKAGMELVDGLYKADDYAMASRLLSAIQPLTSGDKAQLAACQSRARRLSEATALRDRATAALARLNVNPNDVSAQVTYGEFACFVKQDWSGGLPLLAAGGDPSIRIAAKADIAEASDAQHQASIGDAWWNAAEKPGNREIAKTAMNGRAAFWYEKALNAGTLTGLERTRVEKRIATLASSSENVTRASANAETPRSVLLIQAHKEEDKLFQDIAGDHVKVVTKGAGSFLADVKSYPDYSIIVFGVNRLHDLPVTDFTDLVKQSLQGFVRDGGDLVIFGQYNAGGTAFLETLFGFRVGGAGKRGATIPNREFHASVIDRGYTESMLTEMSFSNGYGKLPKDSTVLVRSGDAAVPTAAVVPFGKGRVILIGTTVSASNLKLDEAILDAIYHPKPAK